MRVTAYIRVSTEEQAQEGFSIPAQRDRLTAYAQSQGWQIIGYYVDEGKSAKSTNRPELQRLLNDVRNNQVDIVLVYKLDRLTRSVLDLYQLLEVFEKHNCKFKSATELYDTTTALGRLFITLVAALAQWERENLGERVRMGMTEKVKQGEWHGSKPSYGYSYDPKEKKLLLNDDEVVILRKMFKWYINEGSGDRKIAVRLNELGHFSRKGKPWTENMVAKVLTRACLVNH